MSDDNVLAFCLFLLVGMLGGYMSWRGLYREEFRKVGRNGWYRFPRYTFSWWYASACNLFFVVMPLVAIILIARGVGR